MSSTTNLAVSSIARRSKPPICEKCDNCIKRIANKPKLFDGKEKIMKLLEAIEFLTQKEQQISPDDIVDIFRGGKTVLKTKELVQFALADLVVHSLV
ncbi:14462_t:CDS:2 [Funneliformis geosporum]|nr:14462_t:CDS:2 [Funneliformis geosporum]